MADDEQQHRSERARRLREQIEDLKSGDAPSEPPSSPREFIERQTPGEEEPDLEEDEAGDDED
jgi:hypothetical protein